MRIIRTIGNESLWQREKTLFLTSRMAPLGCYESIFQWVEEFDRWQCAVCFNTSELRYEQLSHKVDQLNAYVEEILHDQNDINDQQEQTNNEVALQIEAINDALYQLRDEKAKPRKPIGFKNNQK